MSYLAGKDMNFQIHILILYKRIKIICTFAVNFLRKNELAKILFIV